MRHVSKILTSLHALTVLAASLLAMIAGCTVDQSGPACQVGPSGIANAPITGTSMADKTLSLTFDGSPTTVSGDVANYLANRQIGAAFFVVGRQLDGGDPLDTIRGTGHMVGNSTYSGDALTAGALPAGELRKVDQLITPYVVGNMFFFRAPQDSFTPKLASYLNEEGLQKYVGPIGGDVVQVGGQPIDAGCWADGASPVACAQRYIQAVANQKKGIVRFTDGPAQLVPLLQQLIPALATGGYSFLRLDSVPEIRRAFEERGATPGTIGGVGGCNDYQ